MIEFKLISFLNIQRVFPLISIEFNVEFDTKFDFDLKNNSKEKLMKQKSEQIISQWKSVNELLILLDKYFFQ